MAHQQEPPSRCLAAAAAALTILAACQGGGGDGTGERRETGGPAPPGLIEEEPPDLSNRSYVDNLLARVNDGEWELGEGLVATLRLVVGEVEAAQVLRHSDLLDYEGTAILEMASEYLEEGADPEVTAEIGRLLAMLVFTNDQLEDMAGAGPLSAALIEPPATGRAQGDVEDCTLYFGEVVGVGECLEFDSASINGKSYRIFRPAPPLPTAGWTDALYALALEAIKETVPKFDTFATTPWANLVFSVAAHPKNFYAAAIYFGPDEPCAIFVYPRIQSRDPGDFKQIIAHELGHCVNHETFPEHMDVAVADRIWWEEGSAEYWGNVAYPANNLEWEKLQNLPSIELGTTLFERSYENSIFFQYLENRIGIDGIKAVIRRLHPGGLASVDGMKGLYHDFAKALTDETVMDTSGVPVPYDAPERTVAINREASPYVERSVKPFGVSRFRFEVDEGRQASLSSKAEGDLQESARSPDGDAWSAIPGLLPYQDCQREIVVVATTTEPGGQFRLDVPTISDVVAGDSVEGDWVVDNSSIIGKMQRVMPVQTLDSISGSISVTFGDDGSFEVEYMGFSVSGHSVVNLTEGAFSSDYQSTFSSTTDARGVDGYEAKGDYIFYDNPFMENYLEGTDTVTTTFEGTFLRVATEEEEIELETRLPDSTTETYPADGWNLFGAANKYALECDGLLLRLDDEMVLQRSLVP